MTHGQLLTDPHHAADTVESSPDSAEMTAISCAADACTLGSARHCS